MRRRAAIIVFYALVAAGSAASLAAGLRTGQAPWTIAGVAGLIAAATTGPLAVLLATLVDRAPSAGARDRLLAEIREHTMLSDAAKRTLFRDREIALLRGAIEDDIARSEYNAALALCDEMAELFGYRQEAETFRSRIGQARREQYELEVAGALDEFDAALDGRDWAAVHQQAARIRRLYPDSHVVADLDQRIHRARDEHKRELEAHFIEAAERDDVEGAMGLLKQLDRYLGREEAGRLTEVAQGVIVRHRENLGGRFRVAVGERRWSLAAQLGEAIVAEFPNSKMATEVRPMLEVLRSRAGQATVGAD